MTRSLLGFFTILCVIVCNANKFTAKSPRTAIVGISSGAFLASQYHVTFSSELIGVGMVAGGPYYCAQGSISTAEISCMYNLQPIDVSSLESVAKTCASNNQCDNLSNIQNQKVWLFSGTQDSVVKTAVVQAAGQFYTDLGADVNETFSMPAEHSWPTNDFGNACNFLGSPYINNCMFDSAFAMTNFIFGDLKSAQPSSESNLGTISQASYTPGGVDPASISFGPSAYLYTPTACNTSSADCGLIIALHGCQQTIDDIDTKFITNSGLNEIGEANNLFVLYPQAIKSQSLGNPEGCFDWWGYTNSNYANNQGLQLVTINNMAKFVLSH